MSNANIIDLNSYKTEYQVDAGFLQLIDNDTASNPSKIKPMPSQLMSRMAALIQKAEANSRGELLKG